MNSISNFAAFCAVSGLSLAKHMEPYIPTQYIPILAFPMSESTNVFMRAIGQIIASKVLMDTIQSLHLPNMPEPTSVGLIIRGIYLTRGTFLSAGGEIIQTLLVDSSFLLPTALASIRAVKNGIQSTQLSLTGDVSTASRLTNGFTGLFGMGVGLYGMSSIIDTLTNLGRGLAAYWSLDAEQQYFTLQSQSLRNIGSSKECKAVIIDGLRSDISGLGIVEDFYWPHTSKAIYSLCEARTYWVNSASDLCEAAKKGANALGEKLDLLVLDSHGLPGMQHLGKDYFLRHANVSAITCATQYLKPDAQILAMGCDSATREPLWSRASEPDQSSLIEEIAKNVKGREVVGFEGDQYPYLNFFSWTGEKLKIEGQDNMKICSLSDSENVICS